MSAPVLQRRKSTLPKPILALGAALLLCGLSYYALVYREDAETVDARATADQYRAEVARATRYLEGRPDNEHSLATIQGAAAALDRMVPQGRDDVPVLQYLQTHAAALGIADFKGDVVGGIVMPEETQVAKTDPERRLPTSPAHLKGQIITMDFTASYRDFLAFEKEVATSPRLIELLDISLKRRPPTPLSPGESVGAHLEVRYLYQ